MQQGKVKGQSYAEYFIQQPWVVVSFLRLVIFNSGHVEALGATGVYRNIWLF